MSDSPAIPVSIWSPCPDPNGAVIPFPGGDHDLTCLPALYTYNTREAMRRPAFESPAPGEPALTFDGLPVGRLGKIGFKALMDAARDAGHGVFVRSAFRAHAMQSATFSMWVSREVMAGRSREEATRRVSASSARAGHSEHQLGTTADLVYRTPQATIYDGWDPETIASSPPMQWVAANAHRFGIVLTYDRDHVEVTQYVWEPWHYRFVGVEAANTMKECGLTTEEFLQRRYAAEPPPPYSPRPPRTARR